MELHPTQFSVMGNMNLSSYENCMVKFTWGDNTYGKKKPLFGLHTTIVDSKTRIMLTVNKLRHQPIINAIITHVTHNA
jgi:hypothetical protein